MFDTFLRSPRYERKRSVFNESFIEQNCRQNTDDFSQECVRIHNHYRVQHGCPPLQLSYSICAISQEWANKISIEDHFHHSNHPQYGENLFVSYMSNTSMPEISAQQVVESWYSEHAFYPFNGPITRDIISKAGHFTQVIWSNSRELGIGKAISKNNRIYVVANYYPAGNVLRKFEENVPHKIHNNSHLPYYYNRRIRSRRIDADTSLEDLRIPQYHRSPSRLQDTEIQTEVLHMPTNYARKFSSKQLDTSITNLQVPHFYQKRNSSKLIVTSDSSAEDLHIPQNYVSRYSNMCPMDHVYPTNNRASKGQYDFADCPETLYVPQYHARRSSSKFLSLDSH